MKFRRSIGQGFEDKLCGYFICPTFRIDKLQVVSFAGHERELRQVGEGSIRVDHQRNNCGDTGFVSSGLAGVLFPLTPALSLGERESRFTLWNKLRGDHRLVELQIQVEFRTFNGAEPPGVFDSLVFQAGIFGISDINVSTFEPRKFEDANVEIFGVLAGVIDAVSQIARNFRDATAEHRISERFGQWNTLRVSVAVGDYQI